MFILAIKSSIELLSLSLKSVDLPGLGFQRLLHPRDLAPQVGALARELSYSSGIYARCLDLLGVVIYGRRPYAKHCAS